MIERYLLRYFLAVVDQGNFSRAAAHCLVSQPTLSVGIAKLEQAVGAPLFLRSNQRVELTEAGSRLLSHARRIERDARRRRRRHVPRLETPLEADRVGRRPRSRHVAALAAGRERLDARGRDRRRGRIARVPVEDDPRGGIAREA